MEGLAEARASVCAENATYESELEAACSGTPERWSRRYGEVRGDCCRWGKPWLRMLVEGSISDVKGIYSSSHEAFARTDG
jgi:hypothetical protein